MNHPLRTVGDSAIERFGSIRAKIRSRPLASMGASLILLGFSGRFLVWATAQRALLGALGHVALGSLVGVLGLYLFALVLESAPVMALSRKFRAAAGALALLTGATVTVSAVGSESPRLAAFGLVLSLISLVALSLPLLALVERDPRWPLIGGLVASTIGVLLVLVGDFVDRTSITGLVLFVLGTQAYSLGVIPWFERFSQHYQRARRWALVALVASVVLIVGGALMSRQMIVLPAAHLAIASLIVWTAAVLDRSFAVKVPFLFVAGALAAGTAYGILYVVMDDAGVSLVIAVTAGAIGAWFVFRGEGIIAIVLIGFVVVWGIADRTTETALDPNPDAQSRILALGDSFMSGEGAPEFFPGTNRAGANRNECRRAPTAYAYLVAERLGMGLDFYACSAATTDDIHNEGQMPDSAPGVVGGKAQLENLTDFSDIDVVIVSIGGNDAGFGRIVQGCLLPGNCADRSDDWFANVDAAGPKIKDAYAAIKDAAKDTPVVAIPYPNLLAEVPCNMVLTSAEQEFLVELIARLNGVVAAAAAAAGVHVFEAASSAFDGRTLCADDPAPNFVHLSPAGGGFFDRLSP
ncbi:MAG: hypothetical protein GXP35_05430, partial [Actinobacteria bacterium]|nr:hypothetical protein [Actinomycetota bacterium]